MEEEILKKAKDLFANKQYGSAIIFLDKLIISNYKIVEVYNRRGRARLRLGKYIEAITDFDAAISINPEGSAAYGNKAICFERQSKFKEAIEYYDKAIMLSEKNLETSIGLDYSNRGLCKKKMGDLAGAKLDWEKAIKYNDWYAKKLYKRYFSNNHKPLIQNMDSDYKDLNHLPDGYGGYIDRTLIEDGLGGEDEAYWSID